MIWHRLASPEGTQGLLLQAGAARQMILPSFHPSGEWVAGQHRRPTVWSLARAYPMVLPVFGRQATFSPDGSELIAASRDDEGAGTYAWPLDGRPRRKLSDRTAWMELSPDGHTLAFGGGSQSALTVPVLERDGSPEHQLIDGFADQTTAIDFSPDGKLVAAVGGQFDQAERVVKVWDVASGDLVAMHDPAAQPSPPGDTPQDETTETDGDIAVWHLDVTFAGNRKIVWTGGKGTFLWDLDLDEQRLLTSEELEHTSVDRAATFLVGRNAATLELFRLDFDSGQMTELTAFGTDTWYFALSPDGAVLATAAQDGTIRVGAPTNEEPHLLFTHTGLPSSIALDPNGRWIATTSAEEIRLWPMPELSRPPLHTLPYAELLTTLRSLTNVRLVEDPETPEGWSLTFEPFPGWESTPLW